MGGSDFDRKYDMGLKEKRREVVIKISLTQGMV
jgi:hypothetical protein